MATNREIEENNRLLREQNELLKRRSGLNEDILDENRDLANILRDQTKEMKLQVSEKGQLRNIGNSLVKLAQETYAVTSDDLAASGKMNGILKLQEKLKKDLLALSSLKNKIILEDKELEKEINESIQNQIKAGQKLNAELEKQREITKEISENVGVKTFDGMTDIVKAIPGLRKFSKPFEDAASAVRKAAAEPLITNKKVAEFKKLRAEGMGIQDALAKSGATIKQVKAVNLAGGALKPLSGLSGMMKGLQALGPALMKSLGPIGLLISAVKFIVSLFKGANEQTIAIARNLSITKDSARAVRDNFVGISQASKETYITTDNLVKAQSELTEELGRAGIATVETLKAQSFLTERLKLSGSEAAKIAARSEAIGENAEATVEAVLKENAERVKTGKSFLTQKQLLTAISKTTGQIAASFGFSNKAIGEGIAKVSKFGLNLQQAKNIADGLLDFETSISNELEAELLTGKSLNLEKARMMALTGDIAGATEDVMSQMKGLTAEQRKSPLIMKSLASTIGLSVDELQDAYLLETDRTRQAKELERIMREQGATEAENYRKKMGLEQALMKDVKETVTLEEQYKEAVSKVKDLFQGLVSDGIIDILADGIRSLAEWISKLPGMQGRMASSQAQRLGDSGVISKDKAAQLSEAAKGAKWWEYLGGPGAAIKDMKAAQAQATIKAIQEAESNKNSAEINKNSIEKVNDFTIQTHPKDTLVMAGGTKFGEETNALLKELITAVKAGGNVYMDGNKVGQALVLSTTKLS